MYLAAFDTPCDRRRRKIVGLLAQCGARVQGSVFVLEPAPGALAWLERELRRVLRPEDRLLVVAMGGVRLWQSAHGEGVPGWEPSVSPGWKGGGVV